MSLTNRCLVLSKVDKEAGTSKANLKNPQMAIKNNALNVQALERSKVRCTSLSNMSNVKIPFTSLFVLWEDCDVHNNRTIL